MGPEIPIVTTIKSQIAVSRVDELSLFVAAEHFDDDDWADWLEMGTKFTRDFGVSRFILNYSTGSGPTTRQRAALAAVKDQFGFDQIERQVLLTDSVLMRGAIAAMSWLIRPKIETKCYSLSQVDKAFGWLAGGAHFDRDRALMRLNELSERVGLPKLSV